MSAFETRERAEENKFAHDQELRFKIDARRRKLLGIWAGETMSMNEAESLKYALDIVNYGIDDETPRAVFNKIITDAEARKVTLTYDELSIKNKELAFLAERQVMQGI